MKVLDALFAANSPLPASKRPSTSVTATLGVGGGMTPFPKVHLGEQVRDVAVTFSLYQAAITDNGRSFSSGMVVRVPVASNVGQEQLFAIVGFARVNGPKQHVLSDKARFIRSAVQGAYVVMAKVWRCMLPVTACLLLVFVDWRP
jgi:hypothetical protein